MKKTLLLKCSPSTYTEVVAISVAHVQKGEFDQEILQHRKKEFKHKITGKIGRATTLFGRPKSGDVIRAKARNYL